jgi:hypothetical protein
MDVEVEVKEEEEEEEEEDEEKVEEEEEEEEEEERDMVDEYDDEEEADDGARPGPGQGVGFTSRFKGVSWKKQERKWRAAGRDKAQNKTVHLGYFANEEDAARAYQDHGGHGAVVLRRGQSSRFKGVSWRKDAKKWEARCWNKAQKKYVHIGHFAIEEDVARAYQNHVGAKELVYVAAPAPAAAAAAAPAGPSAAQNLTEYEREADLGVVGLAGKAGLAPPPELQPKIPPPPPPHRPAHQAAAARASTTASKSDCADAGAFNVGATEEEAVQYAMQTVNTANTANADSAAALEVAAMEAQIEALEAKGEAAVADATAKAAIAEADAKAATVKANVKLAEANAKAALAAAKAALAEKRLAAANAPAAALG